MKTILLRITSLLLSLVFVAGVFCFQAAATSSAKALCGDVNGDDKVNSYDASLVLRYEVKLVSTLSNLDGADVNCDMKIDSLDASLILRYEVGMFDTLPIVTYKEKMIDVPKICQFPTLPTGCESVAATMVLQYYGESITAEDFVRNYLEYNSAFTVHNGIVYRPSPYDCFVGDPFKNGYGCYAGPIVTAVNKTKHFTAKQLNNISLHMLCLQYINNNKPILIWATMYMEPSAVGHSWYLEDGTEFTWISGEHCLVLVGYNENSYFLNDPLTGAMEEYPKDVVEQRYKELGSQAVYISRR